MERLKSGVRSRVWADGDRIVKQVIGDAAAFTREVTALRLVEHTGMVPRVLDVDPDTRTVVLERLPSHPFDEDWVIDANFEGNDARWINHSCSPNCEAILDENEDDPKRSRVFIEAIRAIKPGEELTYDYGITLAERHTPRLKKIWACRCGSRNCTGTMLRPKR